MKHLRTPQRRKLSQHWLRRNLSIVDDAAISNKTA
jgi:hypothetical protein